MILTVTCNPAVDVTYRVAALTPGTVHRVQEVHERPGGKGVNVARTLCRLGVPVTALGLADGRFEESVRDLGVTARFVNALPQVRRTVVVHDGPTTTSFWEPGRTADPSAAGRLIDLVAGLVGEASVLVVSGSLPGGVDPTLPSELGEVARAVGVPAVLDLDDAPLATALERGGCVLTPNLEELSRLGGAAHIPDAAAVARNLARRNGAPMVVTLGRHGMLATDGERCWHAVAPERVAGNPTGAGDAAVAGIADGLARGEGWPEVLARAAALGAAAVLAPTAGEIDLDAYLMWASRIAVTDVDTLKIES